MLSQFLPPVNPKEKKKKGFEPLKFSAATNVQFFFKKKKVIKFYFSRLLASLFFNFNETKP